MFEAEKIGLEELRKANTIRVPKPFMVQHTKGSDSDGAFLVMEYIPFGNPRANSSREVN
jgi:fructosamine-3-kinase